MVNIFFIFPMFLIYFNDGVDSLNRPKFSLFFKAAAKIHFFLQHPFNFFVNGKSIDVDFNNL